MIVGAMNAMFYLKYFLAKPFSKAFTFIIVGFRFHDSFCDMTWIWLGTLRTWMNLNNKWVKY
jgi:hypothetical protein